MTEKRVDILTDAIAKAYKGWSVQPIVGFLTDDDGQTGIDFSVDIYADTFSCEYAPQFIADVEKVCRFCENLNAKNLIEEDTDEAIADEKKIIGMLAKAIKAEDYETIYDFIGW